MDKEKNPLNELITDHSVPKCPHCGNKGMIFHRMFSTCSSQSCNWVGSSMELINTQLGKVTIARGGMVNSNHHDHIEDLVSSTLNNMGLPYSKHPLVGAMTSIYPKSQDRQDSDGDGKLGSSLNKIVSKLHYVAALSLCDQFASTEIRLGSFNPSDGPHNRTMSSAIGVSELKQKGKEPEFNVETSIASDKVFRKKVCCHVTLTNKGDNIIGANVLFALYGRPTYEFTADYNQSGGLLDGSFWFGYSNKELIWQPFDWTSMVPNSGNEIRLAGVLQGADDNLTYVVTESMDSPTFVAQISKRKLYSQERQIITSKAETVEDAIRRLRTSFEKTVVSTEEQGLLLDFSWIKDWNYDTERFVALTEICQCPIWDQNMACEMMHFAGYKKEELFQSIYKDHLESIK